MPPPSRPISPAFFSIWAIRCSSLCCFQLGDRGHHFLLHKFFGGLADQALVIGKIRGSEDVFGAAGIIRNAPPRLRTCETGAVAMIFSP